MLDFLLVGGGASAETAVDRGRYLVTTIIACGNCHTPKDANGQPILSRALSGGLSFDTPNFSGTASNRS
jgi:mono/diheme cytochrome c family protein